MFNMQRAKPVTIPLGTHLKLSTDQSLACDSEKEEMINIPCASEVGSIMYGMVCSRPD